MSVQRTPPSSVGAVACVGVSQPDLSLFTDTDFATTLRKRKKPDDEDFSQKLDNFRAEMTTMISEFCKGQKECTNRIHDDILTIKEQFSSIKSSINNVMLEQDNLKKTIDTTKTETNNAIENIKFEFTQTTDHLAAEQADHGKRIHVVEKDLETIHNLESQVSHLTSIITHIQNDNNRKEQIARLCNIEIQGIPELVDENIIKWILRIGELAGVALTETDIEHAHRVKPMRPLQGQPKNIVVKLKNRLLRDAFISGIRKRRGFTTADLGLGGDQRSCFVNEHLTSTNKILYKKCRSLAKERSYEYVWIKNGTIHVRKTDKQPYIVIATDQDLKKIC